MAPAKNKKAKADGEKLTKRDVDFYRKIGSMGGKSTLKRKGKAHFKKAAVLSHATRHGAGSPAPAESADNQPAQSRAKTRR